jgi:hypothetical protein
MINPNFEFNNNTKIELNQSGQTEIEKKSASKIYFLVFKRLSIFIVLIILISISIYLHESDIGRKHRFNI